jgi:hypothetical protein
MKKRTGSNPDTALHADPTTTCMRWMKPGGGFQHGGCPRGSAASANCMR